MKINTKILLTFVILFTIFSVSIGVILLEQVKRSNYIKDVRTAEFKSSFSEIVKLKSSSYNTIIYDYTYWDEFVDYISSKSKDWEESNLVETMRSQKYDYTVVYDDNQNMFFYKQNNILNVSIKDFLKLDPIDLKRPIFSNYFIVVDGELIQIFSAPIQPIKDIARVTQPKGYMVIGKIWNEEFIKGFETITKQQVELSKLDDTKQYDFKYKLNSYDNKPVAYLGINLDNTIIEIIYNTFTIELITMIISGVIIFFVLMYQVYLLISKPMEQISKIIKTKDQKEIENLLKRSDEFREIAELLKNFLDQTTILEQYKNAIDIGFIVSKTDPTGKITYANKNFEQVSGYTLKELVGKNHNIVRHPESPRILFEDLWKSIQNKKVYNCILKNRAKNGSPYYLRAVISPILNARGEIVEYISMRTDVTEIFKQMEIITNQKIDNLTTLPNKLQFLEDLKIEGNKSLVFLNISGFREINQSFGSDTGDKVLVMFANMTQKMLDFKNTLYRVAGDEFAILCLNCNHKNIVSMLEEFIKKIESQPLLINNFEINLRLMATIASSNDNLLLKKCDMAMHYAKANNLSIVDFEENPQIQKQLDDAKNVTKMIQNAIKFDFVKAYGQKIVNSKNKDDFKVETLMRIINNKGEVVLPIIFLEQSKNARLYSKLTDVMIQKTFENFKDSDVCFSINLTFEDIINKNTVKKLFTYIQTYKMQNRLTIELVESENISNLMEINSFIEEAKSYGCKIAIDDFGSGYSNFAYLLNIKADYIKIDGSLIKDIDTNQNSLFIVKTIVNLAKELKINIVAEYVHSQAVQDIVESLGIEFLQGYHLHKPEPIENLIMI